MIPLAAAEPKQPSAILMRVEGSEPRRAWRAHNATTKGVKAKIMKGLKAWNQVVGISAAPQQEVDGAVGVLVRPQRDGIALLLVGRKEQAHRHEQDQQGGRWRAAPRGRAASCPMPQAAGWCGSFG